MGGRRRGSLLTGSRLHACVSLNTAVAGRSPTKTAESPTKSPSRCAPPRSLTIGIGLGDVVRLERHNEVGQQGVDGGGIHQRVYGVASAQALRRGREGEERDR